MRSALLSLPPDAGPLAGRAAAPAPASLADLAAGDSAILGAIGAESDLRLRMQALGLIPGRRVRVVRKAPFNGPLQVRSGHTCLLIRLQEARSIRVEPSP